MFLLLYFRINKFNSRLFVKWVLSEQSLFTLWLGLIKLFSDRSFEESLINFKSLFGLLSFWSFNFVSKQDHRLQTKFLEMLYRPVILNKMAAFQPQANDLYLMLIERLQSTLSRAAATDTKTFSLNSSNHSTCKVAHQSSVIN